MIARRAWISSSGPPDGAALVPVVVVGVVVGVLVGCGDDARDRWKWC